MSVNHIQDQLASISDVQSEQLLIGCVFRVPDVLDDVAQIQPEHFYDCRHQLIWRALLSVHESRQAVHPVAVAEALAAADQLVAAGDVQYIAEICNNAPDHATHAGSYSGFVLKKWRARRASYGCREVLGLIDEKATDDVIGEKADRVLSEIAESSTPAKILSVRDIIGAALTEVRERLHGGRPAGLQTGFAALDDLVTGFLPHEFIVVAARPGLGKTSFALTMARNIARAGKAVSFHSLEQSQQELCERLLCIESGISGNVLKAGWGMYDAGTRARISEDLHTAAQVIGELPLYIDDDSSQRVRRIAATARRLKRKKDLGLIIVDYLNLVEHSGDVDKVPRHEQVARISKSFKALAKELRVPVLALCAINRAIDTRTDKMPFLSDLKESGSLEHDADVVMFLHRALPGDAEHRDGECDVFVRKNRRGRLGQVTLAFVENRTMFGDLSPDAEAAARARRKGDMPEQKESYYDRAAGSFRN